MSREGEREVIEETSSEARFQDDPDWFQTLNQKFATSMLSESNNTDSQQEADVRQTPTQSSTKSMKGVKKAKYGNKKKIERWDFFDPNAAFTNGIQSDALKPSEVKKITCYRKLIGNTRSVSFQYHTYEDKYGDEKKYPAIMFVNARRCKFLKKTFCL